ncbi:MAG: valine--tRNA ligase [Bacillota bacterium]
MGEGGILAATYSPKEIEDKWYSFWQEKGYFHAGIKKKRKPYCIVIPPPNVTGILHLGHALNNTLQDILVRWKRMSGYDTLWLPGTDHAGIATQAKVEESLSKEGLTKYDLGREKFLERTWAWKEKYGGSITGQLKKLGSSCDWERERFTMDEGCSEAVKEIFVRLYEKGLIYRGEYIINWCPRCHTTISDIEVEHEEKESKLWYIKYPFTDGGGFVTVATTRPETMLGDTAVAVNPSDNRYTGMAGRMLILPVANREIPLIADEFVDPAFGTGAVKVTPAHDPDDFEMGLRHNLPKVTVIDLQGKMAADAGQYQGQDRYECRKNLLARLSAEGFLEKEEAYRHAVGQCYRCDTVIEPLISRQWFVKMKPLAEPAIRVVKEGKVRFVPGRFTKVYLGWMENIRDWCISRQLWWGHRIPVWYCGDCKAELVAREAPSACTVCGGKRLTQDQDVLDTWFSSALWPFSTLGWPGETDLLEYFYPTSVLVTARDIIFFWVARMIFMGMEAMKEEPFHEVLIHGLVLDKFGKKMSKSRPETNVDPIEVINEFGADTLRFTLATGTTLGQDQRFYPEKLEGSRNFANKIWNATRFVLMNLDGFKAGKKLRDLPLAPVDRWILSRLEKTAGGVREKLERYDIGSAASHLYEFLWNEYCDWYIEMAKPRLKEGASGTDRETAQAVLSHVLSRTLILLHPFMPFITEELWQHLPHQGESIMTTPWPEADPEMLDEEAEAEMAQIMETVKAVRNTRAEFNAPPGKKVDAYFGGDSGALKILRENIDLIGTLAGLAQSHFMRNPSDKPEKTAAAIARDVIIYLPLAELVDLEKETARLRKEKANLETEASRLQTKLDNPGFTGKAPAEVVDKERIKLEDCREKLKRVQERLREIS